MKTVRARTRVLSDAEIERVHYYSLKILDEIGIHVPNAEMLGLLEGEGCVVDHQSQVVRFPAKVIDGMLEPFARNRKAEDDWPIGRLSAGVSTQVFMVDYTRNERRRGTLDDILKGVRLTDSLENFSSSNAVAVPSDVPAEIADMEAFRAVYTYAGKRGGTYILNVSSAERIIEMSLAIGRGVGFLLDTVSPLKVRRESLETALIFKKRGMRVGFCSMVSSMGSAPATAAGAIVTQNAEHLAGMLMTKCLNGEASGGYPGMAHPLDPSTLMCSFGSPFIARTSFACADIARHYGLTPHGNIALTDSLAPDFQAGFEKGLSLGFGVCAGLAGVGAQGITGADQGNSFEQLVLDDAWISAYNASVAGVEVTDATVGYETIKEVGQGGSFIGTEHTFEYFRDELKSPALFAREPWDARGRSTLLERVHERVAELTAGYREAEPVITDGEKRDIDRIADKAANRARG